MNIEIIRDEQTFCELRADWNELADNVVYPNIFTSHDWQTTWWQTNGTNWGRAAGELLILCIRHEKSRQLLGLVPLYRKTNRWPLFWGRKHLNFIGFGSLTCPEYLGPIIRAGHVDTVCEAVLRFLHDNPGEWDSLFFEDFDQRDPGTSALAEKLKQHFATHSGPGETRLTITFTGDYDTYLQTLSYNSRRQRRKRFNQAQTRFGARIEYPGAAELDTAFPILVDLTTQARSRHGQANPFLDPTYAGFHRELLQRLLPKNRAVLAILYLNDIPAAVWYCFLLGKKCYAYQQGFSPDFEGSPSDVCQQFLIRKLTEERFEEFDYLRGRETYKDSVANSERKTTWLFVFRRRGVAFWSRLLLDRVVRPCWRLLRSRF